MKVETEGSTNGCHMMPYDAMDASYGCQVPGGNATLLLWQLPKAFGSRLAKLDAHSGEIGD